MAFLNLVNYINSFYKKYRFFILVLFLGLLIFSYPMIKSGFDLMPGDKYGFLYNSFTLEHGFLWLNKSLAHNSFWDAPIYYPNKSTLAYSDTLIGILPFYYILRIFIKNPLCAYQGLFILLCILNYSVFYYFLKTLKFSDLASSFGSYIFAFNIIRFFNISDISVFSQFLSILSIIFLTKVNKNNKRIVNHLFFLSSSIFLILQFYSSFTIGFYSVFMAILASLLALLPKNSRDIICGFFKNYYKFLIFYSLVVVFMLLPMIYHRSITGQINEISDIVFSIWDKTCFIRNISFLDTIFYKNLSYIHDKMIFYSSCSLGVFCSLFALFGLIKLKGYKGVPLMLLIATFFLTCGYNAMRFYKYFYYILPFSEWVDSINKIVFITLIVVSIGISQFIKYFEKRKAVLIFAILILVLETFPRLNDINSSWSVYCLSKREFISQINEIIKEIPSDKKIIKVSYKSENSEKFGTEDIKNKESQAQNKVDMISFYLTTQKDLKSVNGHKKIKQKNIYGNYYDIIQTVDFNSI